MRFRLDHDVERVLAFMQENIRAPKLTAVAMAVAQLSPLLWARYEGDTNDPLDRFHPFSFTVAKTSDLISSTDSLLPQEETNGQKHPD
jgi:hypothetical protein